MSIKFFGGVALLVSGVTGPTIAVIPQLFQQAGWLTPTIAFILITILSGSAALFLVESMASISGNEKFQASIEYSTLAELYLGNRWHWALQIVLYIALQSQAITSLIESFQSMDTLLVTIAHKSCAISFQKGWECVSSIPDNGLGVFSGYIFISFGYLITIALVLPLGLIHLSDNIKYQIASFITLLFITIVWIVTFFQVGITNNSIPVVGSNQGTVVGYVISNFAFVTTIPAFVNNIHPSTNIHRVIWLSVIISCAIYLSIGFTGAAAFKTPPNSTILAVISQRRPSLVALISVYVFPIAVLITSIPVFMIIIRYNLLRGNICSKPWAIFFSSILPWIIVIPFQTNGWLTIIMNWTSLFFSSTANLVIPFVLYLVSKRYHASAALDLHQEHDEFRLRPLTSPTSPITTAAIATSPIRQRPPRIQISIPDNDPISSESNHTPLLLSDTADHHPEASSTSGNVIRRIRSPSIHRHYGETGLHSPRKSPISTSHRTSNSVPVGVVKEINNNNDDDDDDDEKLNFFTRISGPAAAAVVGGIANPEFDNNEKPNLTLHIPRASLTVPSSDTTNTTTTAAASPIGASSAAVENYSSSIARSPTHVVRRSLSVQEIKIEIPNLPGLPLAGPTSGGSAESVHRHHHDTSSSPSNLLRRLGYYSLFKNFRIRRISCRDLQSEEVGLEVGGVADGVGVGVGNGNDDDDDDNDEGSSNNTLDDDDDITHYPKFEAFPRLNRTRWFDSIKVAIVFCGLTSVLVCINVVYNIVLAARGSGQ